MIGFESAVEIVFSVCHIVRKNSSNVTSYIIIMDVHVQFNTILNTAICASVMLFV